MKKEMTSASASRKEKKKEKSRKEVESNASYTLYAILKSEPLLDFSLLTSLSRLL